MPGGAEFIHATCVAIGGRGVLLRGPSGSGKSDLALRLILSPSPTGCAAAELVSDDQVALSIRNDGLWAHTAPNLDGKIEVRGIGIVSVTQTPSAPVHLIADAVNPEDVPRMPEGNRTTLLLGRSVPTVALAFLEASATHKIRFALGQIS